MSILDASSTGPLRPVPNPREVFLLINYTFLELKSLSMLNTSSTFLNKYMLLDLIVMPGSSMASEGDQN